MELSNQIADPGLRHRYQLLIQELIAINQALPSDTARALTRHFSTLQIPCRTCNGTSLVSDLIAVLQNYPKPYHITHDDPGPVSHSNCRWICFLCPGRKSVFDHTKDLRRHLKDNHGYSDAAVSFVFNTRRRENDRLWDHFGPCTVNQAWANGWDVRPWALNGNVVNATENNVPPQNMQMLPPSGPVLTPSTRSDLTNVASSNWQTPLGTMDADATPSDSINDAYMSESDDLPYEPLHPPQSQEAVVSQAGTRFGNSVGKPATTARPSDLTIVPDYQSHRLASSDFDRMLEDERAIHGWPSEEEDSPITEICMFRKDDPFDLSNILRHPPQPAFETDQFFMEE